MSSERGGRVVNLASAPAARPDGRRPLQLLTGKELAKLLRKSESWVAHKATAGLIPSIKLLGGARRYDVEEIEKWIRSQKAGG